MEYKQRSRISSTLITLLAACGLIASSAIADLSAGKPDIKEVAGIDGISWETGTAYKSARLTVSGPEGFRMEENFQVGDTLFLDFAAVAKSASLSGRFTYELEFTPLISAADKALADEARALGEDVGFLAQKTIPSVSGTFSLENGTIVDASLPETTLKDIVHPDDVIIQGSLCVGFDCVNGESFGFDTIRLKENNLRIHFDDTSTTASFPRNEFRIVINDTSNGGAEYFAVEDSTAGRQPFRITAGAPANSLFVSSAGRIGIGTSSPTVNLHVKTGNTPTLRLEQDGTSGFTPQIWDVAGNEANFFIRDATNGSTLPLRIEPGAPSNMIYIDGTDDRVGIGTASPSQRLHVVGTGNLNPTFEATDNSAVQFRMKSNSSNRRIVGRDSGDNSQTQIVLGDAGKFQFFAENATNDVCLEFRDSDGAGTTSCTFLNGAINCAAVACP